MSNAALSPPALPQKLTLREVAAWLHATPFTIRRMRRLEGFPEPVRLGRKLLFDRAEVESWLASRKK